MDEDFKPAYMIVAGKFNEYADKNGAIFWDDRDPDYAGKAGTVCAYIFRKSHPFNVDLGHLKIEQEVDVFYLVDNVSRVCLAIVNYFHERHASIYIETFEPFRRRGYATKLLGWISDWLTENGYIHEDGCAVDNRAVLGLYLKLGFKIDGRIHWARVSSLGK